MDKINKFITLFHENSPTYFYVHRSHGILNQLHLRNNNLITFMHIISRFNPRVSTALIPRFDRKPIRLRIYCEQRKKSCEMSSQYIRRLVELDYVQTGHGHVIIRRPRLTFYE